MLDEGRNYARVTSRLIQEGSAVRVYLDDQQAPQELPKGLAEEVARILDEEVIPRSREILGAHADCDGDGKLTVLLTPWLGKLQGGRTSLRGCVRSSDFRRSIPPPFSNQADVLYLNSNLQPDAALKTLLAHEYTHAVCFSRRLAVPREAMLPEEDDWLNEGLAHLAENVHRADWSNLDYRVARYLENPAGYSLVVSDYFRAGLWRDHGCRGATFLFLRWCMDQSGEGLLPALLEAPGRGTANVEHATGVPFEELFRHWTIAVWQSRPGQHTRSTPYKSLDLCGPLGTVRLNGPHGEVWNLGAEPKQLTLRGTSAAYVRLATSGTVLRRIRVTAISGARLQLTLVRTGAAL